MDAAWRRALELEPRPRPGPGLVRDHASARAGSPTRGCRSSSARGRPIRSRPFPTRSPRGGCSCCGSPQEALRYAEDALSFEKEDASALAASCMANVALGRLRRGHRGGRARRRDLAPGALLPRHPGLGARDRGPRDEARAILEELRARPAGSPTAVSEAWLLGALGEIDEAFAVIARAEEECQGQLYYTGVARVRSAPLRPALRGPAGPARVTLVPG